MLSAAVPTSNTPVPQGAELIEVEVVRIAGAGRLARVRLRVGRGATVADALSASGVLEEGEMGGRLAVARFGERVAPDATLFDGDRIDLCRALVVDPKEARRRRAGGQRRTRSR